MSTGRGDLVAATPRCASVVNSARRSEATAPPIDAALDPTAPSLDLDGPRRGLAGYLDEWIDEIFDTYYADGIPGVINN